MRRKSYLALTPRVYVCTCVGSACFPEPQTGDDSDEWDALGPGQGLNR